MLRVAAVQLEPNFGDVAANLDKVEAALREAAAAGTLLTVLPELAVSGYVFASRAEAFELAEPIPSGPTSTRLSDLASELSIYFVIGLAERSDAKLYNSSAFFGPNGYIGHFRKVHLWNRENIVFEPGDLGFPVFFTPIGRIATMICYDGWFPEAYRSCALRGADIVCIPTNWVPIPGQDVTQQAMATLLCMTAAHCNGLSVIAADRVGTERGQEFIGQSLIVSHTGWPVAGPASPTQEQVLYAELDLETARSDRAWNSFNNPLRDRRPPAYGARVSSDQLT